MKTTSLSSVEEESEQCQWENCGGGRYCEKHSLESKGVSLPSVEALVSESITAVGITGKVERTLEDTLTQDRNQAYTRLVEGIEGMIWEQTSSHWCGDEKCRECLKIERIAKHNQLLTDLLENVVKPLYGKE